MNTPPDPDWFLKLSLGRGDEIRGCSYTNDCEGLDAKHKTVTCQLWNKAGIADPGVGGSPCAPAKPTRASKP